MPSKECNFIQGLFQSCLTPPTHRYAWEWADERRVLTSDTSGAPGKWRTDKTPYVKKISESLARYTRVEDPSSPLGYRRIFNPIRVVVLMKGSQMGGSEIGLNWIGQMIEEDPGPCKVFQPTEAGAKVWSKQRFKKMLETTPSLRDLIPDSRRRDSGNEILIKEFPGGFLQISGANSPVVYRQMPARDVMADDFDGFPDDAGGEGSTDLLILNRLSTFPDSKAFFCSTPTEQGFSHIERLFNLTDQQKFYVPCLKCGEYDTIAFGRLKWPKGEPLKAVCECMYCGHQHNNYHKNDMLPRGEWRPTHESQRHDWIGFQLPAYYAPHGWESWGEIAQSFLTSKDSPELLQVWTNTKDAMPFEDKAGQEIMVSGLAERREEYTPDLLPDGVVVLTISYDVQDDRIEVQIDGYGRDKEYWNIDHVKIYGDPSVINLKDDPDNLNVWKLAKDQLFRTFNHPRFGEMKFSASCLDTGGHYTLNAYTFCRTVKIDRVWAIKGREGKLPVWPKKPSRRNKGKVNLYIVGVDTAKDVIMGNLKIEKPGPAYRHYPVQRDQDYFDQLTSERRKTTYHRGFPTRRWYLPQHRKNEALDLSVYSLAALEGMIASGLDLNKRADRLDEQFPNPMSPKASSEQGGHSTPTRRRFVKSSAMQ